jgi:YD repeat-containing protein
MSLSILALALLVAQADAQEINLRNANFHLEHADVRVQKPGAALELVRHYNSRSTEDGLFGFGWSNPYDVMVSTHADGTLLVVDADGFVLRYTPEGKPWAEIRESFVDRLIQARRTEDKAHGGEREESFYAELKQLWLDKPEEREQATWAYPAAWREPIDGDYISYDRGTETLVRTGGTYQRVASDGLLESFDSKGRLVGRTDSAERGLRLDYDRDGRLIKVAHTDGAGFTLFYGQGGRVNELRDTEGRSVAYAYDDQGNLVQTRGPGQRVIAYAYDEEHNLVAVRQPDGTGLQVLYDVEADWAVALKQGNGVTRYAWELLNPTGEHYRCIVTDPEGGQTIHEFNDLDHVSVITDDGGGTTRTVYSACCAKPLEVTHPDGTVTRYEYDSQARMTGVTTPDGTRARYTYHPSMARIVQASYSDGRRYQYEYDRGGRVTKVIEGAGRVLELFYGANGKVESMETNDGGVYKFEYDVDGRPLRIIGRKGVALDITYGIAGEMKSSQVSTPSSSQKASFYRDLQTVLAMLEPATGAF